MAQTAHKTEEEKKEYFDSPEVLEKKVSELVSAIKHSKHFVVFTGAGISTSSGVPDFRSGVNTVLPTGPGAWEKLATHTKKEAAFRKPMLKAVPSKTHMALVQLSRRDILKFCISQNVDGLHRRSGLPPEKIAELHGNTNLQKCQKCKRKYFRDFSCSAHTKDHKTGRKCICGGELKDSIINFGQNLPEIELNLGFAHSQASDLCLCLGSSLRVSPANQMPDETVANGGKLFIVNIQKTPLGPNGTEIFALCDKVMEMVMEKLQIPIPEFELERIFQLTLEMGKYYNFCGVDQEGTPYTVFTSITVTDSKKRSTVLQQEPFIMQKKDLADGPLNLQLCFQGHYNEPDFSIQIDPGFLFDSQPMRVNLLYNPRTEKWRFQSL